MKTYKELSEKWEEISPYTGGFLLVPDDHPLSFHIGYLSDSQKCFIVLNTGKLDKISSSKAIDVENLLLDDGSYALRFVLNYPSLDEIFIKLCWDLMVASKTASKPVEALISQYKKWLRLLHQVGNGLLPVISQKGLIGELLYLSELIDDRGDVQSIGEWVGPDGADQDYNFSQGWAEVKTTTIAGSTIQVSSLQQFDRHDDGILVVFFMDKTSSSGSQTISLNEAVSMIRSKVSSDQAKEIFDIKLAKCGYQSKDAEEYSKIRFKIGEERKYNVVNDFPRLTNDNTPAPVVDAQYQIDLPAVESYRIKEA